MHRTGLFEVPLYSYIDGWAWLAAVAAVASRHHAAMPKLAPGSSNWFPTTEPIKRGIPGSYGATNWPKERINACCVIFVPSHILELIKLNKIFFKTFFLLMLAEFKFPAKNVKNTFISDQLCTGFKQDSAAQWIDQ